MVNITWLNYFLYPVAAAQLSILRWAHRAKARPGSPASGLGSLGWTTAPAPPLFETLYAAPTTITRPRPGSPRADESRSPHRVAALWRSASAAPPRTPPTCIPSAPTPSADSRPAAAPPPLASACAPPESRSARPPATPCSQLYCVGQPTRMMLAANLDRFKRRSVRLSCPTRS